MINIENVEIESSKDRKTVLRIMKDEKQYYIGSKYNMTREIERFLQEIEDIEFKNIIVVFGLGTGEHIKSLIKCFKNVRVLVIEPSQKIIDANKENSVFKEIIENEMVKISCMEKEDLYTVLNNFFNIKELSRIQHHIFSNYNKIFIDEVKRFYDAYKKVIYDKKIDGNTFVNFAEDWNKSLIRNITMFIKNRFIDQYKNIYKDVPAIIVSAGPSLEKNIGILKEANEKAIIIPGGRTIETVMKNGANPSFLTIMDAGDLSYKLIENVIGELTVPLVCYEGTNDRILREYKGEKIVFTKQKEISRILREDITNIGAGGSVAHVATMFAITMGCNPIIFMGQDCAYSEGKLHADEVSDEVSKKLIEDDESNIRFCVESVNNSMVETDVVLDGFRRSLEAIVKRYDEITFINATEGGARIKGTVEMTLKEAIEKYKKSFVKVELDEKIDVDTRKELMLRELSIYPNELNNIVRMCEKGKKTLEKIDVNRSEKSKIEKVMHNINTINEKIMRVYNKIPLLGDAFLSINFRLDEDEEYFIDSTLSSRETLGKILKKQYKIYDEVHRICIENIDYFKETLDEMLDK
ncbi:6-hydroxymethylpterin diphosphokinase MptE-like protein [uncultured Clostridium sp.]|uniref:motility associated factor glycosyltransferase family protein n=1 Tax=uncultured Clostridium sp. TaxID=59620 RepID=UPI0025DECAA9|nr:6-hydroxymethylpterin diphosphokinase MptE-like protein [uncultured Clostridium sp.]